VDGKQRSLGTFPSAKLAAQAFDAAVRRYRRPLDMLNFPNEDHRVNDDLGRFIGDDTGKDGEFPIFFSSSEDEDDESDVSSERRLTTDKSASMRGSSSSAGSLKEHHSDYFMAGE